MRAGKFYFYQVLTANLSRIINSIGEYRMMVDNLEKAEANRKKADEKYQGDENVENDIEKYTEELKVLEDKRNFYIRIKNKIDTQLFSRYERKGFIQECKEWLEDVFYKFIK